MKVIKTRFDDVLIFQPNVYDDIRGYFYESFNESVFKDLTNLSTHFVQDNHSLSKKNVLRGLHYQKKPYEQAKLVRVISGQIYDVVVDIRKDSKNFGKWLGFNLSSENRNQLWIPRGYAHGFLSLDDNTEVFYKTDNFYNKEASVCINYNDVSLNIDWPVQNPFLSGNDQNAIKFSEYSTSI